MIERDDLNVLDLEVGSEEWKRFRRGEDDSIPKIGGSTISKIMGVNPFVGPEDLWLYLTGRITEEELRGDGGQEVMWWGRNVEPIVLKRYQEERDDLYVYPEHRTFQSEEKPWMVCSPDGFGAPTGEEIDRVIEAKCKFSVWRSDFKIDIEQGESDEIPYEYLCQAQWNAGLLGLEKTVVPARLSTKRKSVVFNIYSVDFDEELFQTLVDRAEQFVEAVQNDERPEGLTEEERSSLLKTMFSEPETDEIKKDGEADIIISEYRDRKEKIKEVEEKYEERIEEETGELKEEKEELENEIKEMIGDDLGVKGDSFRAKWTPINRWNIKSEAIELLEEEHPEVLERLLDEGLVYETSYRRLYDKKLN